MRKIALAALLVVLATPAWAGNVDEDPRQAAYELCRDSGTSANICTMKHAASEAGAVAQARQTLEVCKSDDPKDYLGGIAASCLKDRAYIKQRWGY